MDRNFRTQSIFKSTWHCFSFCGFCLYFQFCDYSSSYCWVGASSKSTAIDRQYILNNNLYSKNITVFVWTSFAIKFAKFLLGQISASKRETKLIQKSTLPLFNNLAVIIIIATVIYFLFLAWGIDVSAWLASAGIIGLVLSFAAKDTLANLFAGVFILVDTPYKLGDYIVLDSGERGQVTHIGIRRTRLLTRDDVEITVPNSVMGNAKITNEAGEPSAKHRVRVKVGVAYSSDIDNVREVLEQIAINNHQVCKTPEPRVRFRNFGNSSLDFELLCWVDMPVLRGQVLDKLYTEVYKKFMELGIEIPYTKQDVYIKSVPSTWHVINYLLRSKC